MVDLPYKRKMEDQKRDDGRQALIDRVNRRKVCLECYDSPAGRAWLLNLIRDSFFFNQAFTNNGITAFNLGHHQNLLDLWKEIPIVFAEVILQLAKEEEDRFQKELLLAKRELDMNG